MTSARRLHLESFAFIRFLRIVVITMLLMLNTGSTPTPRSTTSLHTLKFFRLVGVGVDPKKRFSYLLDPEGFRIFWVLFQKDFRIFGSKRFLYCTFNHGHRRRRPARG